MNNIIEAELERKLDQGTIDGEEMFTPTSNREEIETQLIRKFMLTQVTIRACFLTCK
jgi:hypothetical protein